jgi:hypothetical protein
MGGGLWAFMMVKNEADTVGGVIRHMASEGARGVAILDNGSTDSTREAIADASAEVGSSCEVIVEDDPEVGYYQSRKITSLINRVAQERPLGWVIAVDADEIWHADVPLVEFFEDVERSTGRPTVVSAALLSHFCTAADDPTAADPFQRMMYRTTSVAPLPKVAFRYRQGAVVAQGNHSVQVSVRRALDDSALTVRHFPYRSVEQFVQKGVQGARAYAASDLPEGMGTHWRSYGAIYDRLGEQGLADVYREHFWFSSPIDSGLVLDPAPYRRW